MNKDKNNNSGTKLPFKRCVYFNLCDIKALAVNKSTILKKIIACLLPIA
jgi:hypothetical protein